MSACFVQNKIVCKNWEILQIDMFTFFTASCATFGLGPENVCLNHYKFSDDVTQMC